MAILSNFDKSCRISLTKSLARGIMRASGTILFASLWLLGPITWQQFQWLQRTSQKNEDDSLFVSPLGQGTSYVAGAIIEPMNVDDVLFNGTIANKDHRYGAILLGMHRSGTSLLCGLLHLSFGYIVGGPLLEPASDNEKGFFELSSIVLQNDLFMNEQNVTWKENVMNYDWRQALREKKEGTIDFEKNGIPGMAFLNNASDSPWLQKDPRMCITLKTWLNLMMDEPAIIFTYRHPLEVAMSLKNRDQLPLHFGFRLWIVYNMKAIQNSRGLCVVHTSNDAVLGDPVVEVQKISEQLTRKCKVIEPPHRFMQNAIIEFFDNNLQHHKRGRTVQENGKEALGTHNSDKCVVYTYDSEERNDYQAQEQEREHYALAMKIYCDLESGIAYKDSYVWPELP